jgi:hypothetical protein
MERIKVKTIVYIVVAVMTVPALATIRYVPQEHATIQEAIDVCEDYDTVVVAKDTYSGPGNCNLKLSGKVITVRSTDPTDPQTVNATIINCGGTTRGFSFYSGESTDTKVEGFTITNGYALLGGAIYCYNNSSPSINNCVITNNSAALGGGIAIANTETAPVISGCLVTANTAMVGGGGIYCNGASPQIKNCVITANFTSSGGAMYSHNAGEPTITNCTISANNASNLAGGIYCYRASNLLLNNSILWADTAPSASEIMVGNLGAPTSIQIAYCDIQGLDQNVWYDTDCTVNWGEGNIDADPLFDNAVVASSSTVTTGVVSDYHLLKWSPCIDAGDPTSATGPDETDIDGNPRIIGEQIDLGADEYEFPIPAIVDIKPATINLTGGVKHLNCSIKLPETYSVTEINTDSIALNETEEPVQSKYDGELAKLMVKFELTQELLDSAQDSTILLTVTGRLYNNKKFEGTDTIRIVQPKRGKGKK